ncbi:unnamed protein product [Closterium sp. NIES-65]|nr:unnamed protein product [Closterium sp. NIES-65]
MTSPFNLRRTRATTITLPASSTSGAAHVLDSSIPRRSSSSTSSATTSLTGSSSARRAAASSHSPASLTGRRRSSSSSSGGSSSAGFSSPRVLAAAARLLLVPLLVLTAAADCFPRNAAPPPLPSPPRRPDPRHRPPPPRGNLRLRAPSPLRHAAEPSLGARLDFPSVSWGNSSSWRNRGEGGGSHGEAREGRALLRVEVTAATAAAVAERPVALGASQLRALVQLQEAWRAWAGNSNATTACSAWAGVTCSPNGAVVALDSKAFTMDPPPTGTIPAAITDLAALQYLALGADGCLLTGTVDDLSWLSSLSALHTLHLSALAEVTGDLSSFAMLSHIDTLQDLMLRGFSGATGEIPREIRYMTALTALDLSYLRAVEFPNWVTHLSNLQSL